MRFFVALLGGLVAGIAGAVWYSQQTGRDLRDEFRTIRADVQARDFEGLANHLEERFKELQASVEKMSAQANEWAEKTGEDARSAAQEAVEEAQARTDEAHARAEETAQA